MGCLRLCFGRAKAIALLALLPLIWSQVACGQTVLQGRILDPASRTPVEGVAVRALLGATSLATVNSGPDGAYQLSVALGPGPRSQIVTLLMRHSDYVDRSHNVTVTAGQPDTPFLEIELLPRHLAQCRLQAPHPVIVGHFRSPPVGEAYRDLSGRIAHALTYHILTVLQTLNLSANSQPEFRDCPEAQPRVPMRAGAFARALEADVFLFGDVIGANGSFQVNAYVSDPFELFMPPLRAENRGVDLADPGIAEMDASTYAAILTAIALGYEDKGNADACVEATVAAEQLAVDSSVDLLNKIRESRARCQSQLPNRALLEGGGQ